MASKRSAFARQAEINRCIRLIDHYADKGWPQRCDWVFAHLQRLWDCDDRKSGRLRLALVSRKWWMAKAHAMQVHFPSTKSMMPVTSA